MKLDVPGQFLSESAVYFLHLSIRFFEDYNKECPLRKVKQLYKCSLEKFVVNI